MLIMIRFSSSNGSQCKMAAGRAIWLLRLFVLFFLLCEVRGLKGTRNCNIATTHRIKESFLVVKSITAQTEMLVIIHVKFHSTVFIRTQVRL